MPSKGILTEVSHPVHRTNWFLGIGINNYQEFPKLHNAVKDVQDICALLVTEYGFTTEHVTTLFDEEATEENVIGALDDLADELGKDDTLLIYFSGHGHMTNKGLGFWIPQDAKRGNTARYIPNSRIRDVIGTFDAQHVFLISDSCFSGSLLTRGTPRSTRLLKELDSSPSRWALCSGRADEEVDDGIPGTNSPFALSIKNVLQDSQEPELGVTKLIDRVREQVAANSRQIPEGHPIQDVGHGWGEYIFRRPGFTTHNVTESSQVAAQTTGMQFSVTETLRPIRKRRRSRIKWIALSIVVAIGIGLATLAYLQNRLHIRLEHDDDSVVIHALGGKTLKGFRKQYEIFIKNPGVQDVRTGEYGEVMHDYCSNSPLRYHYSLFDGGNPGHYEVTIRDQSEAEVTKEVIIPASYVPPLKIEAFHTTSEINVENRWPVDRENRFKVGDTVHVYASIMAQSAMSVIFVWNTGEPNAPEAMHLTPSDEPYRLHERRIAYDTSTYSVDLITSEGALLAQTWYRVTEK